MKRFSSLITACLLPASGFLHATDFSVLLPSELTFLLESRNIPEQQQFWEMTPLYTSLQEVNWDVLLDTMGEGDPDFNARAVKEVFNEVNTTRKALLGQFTDSAVFAFGDMEKLFALIKNFDDAMEETLAEAAAALGENQGDEDEIESSMDEEDIEFMQTLLGTVYFMADIKDEAETDRILSEAADRLLQVDEEKMLSRYEGDGIKGLEGMEGEKSLEFGIYWAVKEKILIMGLTRNAVQMQLEWIQSPPVNALANNDDYIRTREEMLEDYHSLLFLPLSRWINPMFDFLAEEGDLENPEMLQRIRGWLDPDALLPVSQSFKLTENSLSTRTRVGFRQECGLQRLFLSPWGDVAPHPSFAHKNFGSISAVSWSLRRFYEALEAELPKIAPEAAGGLGMARMFASAQLGFDYKLQLLDHLGDGVVAFQTVDAGVVEEIMNAQLKGDIEEQVRLTQLHPTEGQYYLFGLELKNQEAIRQTLNLVLAKLHPQGIPEPEMYRGVPIHFPMKGMGIEGDTASTFTYTFLNNYLLVSVGRPNLLHMAVDADQDPDLQVWKMDEFSSLRDRFQFQAQGQDFTSGKMFDAVMNMVKKGFLAGFAMEADENTTQIFSQELNKISFGMGGSLSVQEVTELEIKTHTVQEYHR